MTISSIRISDLIITGPVKNENTVNFSGSNNDGSFTTAVSNSFLSSLAQKLIAADIG